MSLEGYHSLGCQKATTGSKQAYTTTTAISLAGKWDMAIKYSKLNAASCTPFGKSLLSLTSAVLCSAEAALGRGITAPMSAR